MVRAILALQVLGGDDAIDEAVLQEELAGLKALGQLDADGGLDGPRAGKTDQRPGSAKTTSPSEAKLAATPPMVGLVSTE